MPARNVVRQFIENQYLHIYNRGVEKRKIFLDDEDYKIFLYYLFIYLADPALVINSYPKLRFNLKNNNLYGKISLIAFCLMPNHFHLLVHQNQKEAATKLLKQVTNAYTKYFNTKYNRVGPLMQGKYKAVAIDNDTYLLHLSRYIHQNPLKINFVLNALRNYPWSSYPLYIGLERSNYIKHKVVLDFFSTQNSNLSYESFVESSLESVLPQTLALEDE